MKPGHWLGRVLPVSFSALTLLVGWRGWSLCPFWLSGSFHSWVMTAWRVTQQMWPPNNLLCGFTMLIIIFIICSSVINICWAVHHTLKTWLAFHSSLEVCGVILHIDILWAVHALSRGHWIASTLVHGSVIESGQQQYVLAAYSFWILMVIYCLLMDLWWYFGYQTFVQPLVQLGLILPESRALRKTIRQFGFGFPVTEQNHTIRNSAFHPSSWFSVMWEFHLLTATPKHN